MLVQDDDFGRAYEEGFQQAIEGTDIEVVATERYRAGASEVSAQITGLAASGADAFFNGGTLLACPDALTKAAAANWKPITWVSGTCISKTLMGLAGAAANDVYSASNLKDPLNPDWDDDPAMQEYLDTVQQYRGDGFDPENAIVGYGYTQAAMFVEALEAAEAPTRLAVMESLHNLDGISDVGLLLPGVSVTTAARTNPTWVSRWCWRSTTFAGEGSATTSSRRASWSTSRVRPSISRRRTSSPASLHRPDLRQLHGLRDRTSPVGGTHCLGSYHPRVSFPQRRLRRLRRTPALRRLVAETHLSIDDLIAPLFVREGIAEPAPITSLPGVVQHTRESLRKEVHELAQLGVPAVILFGVPATKDAIGSGAWDPDGIVQVALATCVRTWATRWCSWPTCAWTSTPTTATAASSTSAARSTTTPPSTSTPGWRSRRPRPAPTWWRPAG